MRKQHKTYMAKASDKPESKWYVINAEGQILGRLATKIAMMIMGKHRPEYTSHVDCGDHIVVINAAKVRVKGTNKMKDKMYQQYTGFMSGLKETSLEDMLEKKPTEVIRRAVRKMIPKNILGRDMLRKLKVYAGADHRHTAQQPVELKV